MYYMYVVEYYDCDELRKDKGIVFGKTYHNALINVFKDYGIPTIDGKIDDNSISYVSLSLFEDNTICLNEGDITNLVSSLAEK